MHEQFPNLYTWQETGGTDYKSAFPDGDPEGLKLGCLIQSSTQSMRSPCPTQIQNNQLHVHILVHQNIQEILNVPASWVGQAANSQVYCTVVCSVTWPLNVSEAGGDLHAGFTQTTAFAV